MKTTAGYIDDRLLISRARKIRMLVLDVDGVMTNGQILLLPDGSEAKAFSIHDGFGIVTAMRSGVRVGIISGRASEAVQARCAELGIEDVFTERMEKLPILQSLLTKHNLSAEEVAFIGDDLPDLPVLMTVGLSAAPPNAHPDVLRRVHLRLTTRGGEGAVREFTDFLMMAQGKTEKILNTFLPNES